MKIKMLFLAVALLGVMTSFTTKLPATGGVKVKIELPAGVKADLDVTPIELYKTMEDVENAKGFKASWTNEAGEGKIDGVEAGKYFLDAMVEAEDGKVYYSVVEVEIKAGVIGSVVLKLERHEEFEGDLDYEDGEDE